MVIPLKKRDVAYSIVYLRLVVFNIFLGKLGRDGGLLNFLVQNWSKKSGPERGSLLDSGGVPHFLLRWSSHP